FALAVVLPKSRFSLQTTTLLVLLRRFARLAVVALVLLALTGLYSFWRQVGSPGALATPYGETLLVKLALFVPLLLLAAINALFVRAPSPVKRLAPRTRVSAPEQSGVRVRGRSEEHTSELQSLRHLVCRLLLEKKKKKKCNQDQR